MHELLRNINFEPFFDLYDHIDELQFWIKDTKGAFVKVNKGFLANYALENEAQVIGKTDFDLSPYYIADQFFKDDLEVLKGKSIINRVELVYCANQSIRWYITNKRLLFTINGEIAGTIGITRTLSDSAQTEIPIHNLNHIVEYIHKNIHKKISVTDLAAIMKCSTNTLERKFHTLFHCLPSKFIQRIKLEYACKALINDEDQTTEIAFRLGFSDASHFIRDFKKYMHITPYQYRKQYFNKVL